ncbi:acyl-CoA N-acyltransferase [Aspergillus egyptiacus]|nr:acyl-CoA N-acyltransferase [Aspergillus egyptiacus]
MEFNIEPATPDDVAEMVEVYCRAFTDDFSTRLLPPTDGVRAFMANGFKSDIEKSRSGKSTSVLKIVCTAPDQSPVIVGFAVWRFTEDFQPGAGLVGVQWPQGSDSELCARFFLGIDQERKRAIGDQLHYYLDMLAVDPAYGRRGLGAQLLKWGLDRADEERVPTFISASPAGKGLYEKHGSRVLNSYEVVPGYWQTSMVRPVKGRSRG